MENRELIFLKPETLERKLVGKVISRFEDAGFRIEKIKKGRVTKELAELLYPNSEEQLKGMGNKTLKAMEERGGKDKVMEVFGTMEPYAIGEILNGWNRQYATSGEVIAVVIQNEDAPNKARALIGKTDPALADKGTIRGDYAADSIYQANIEKRGCKNLVHASDDQRAAVEIELFEKHFFK